MKPTRILKMAVHGAKARERLKAHRVNNHMCMTCIVRQVYLVTEPDKLLTSRSGLREPLGVNLCI